MHIPDGFLSAPTAVATGAVSAGGVAYALRAAKSRLDDRQIPLVGVTAAFVFAVQMINFPVVPGASGHLVGGALAAILLGPGMGLLVLATVLGVQAIGFADGGITALGANVSLMGLVAAVGGYYLFRALSGLLPRGRSGFLVATAVTSWVTVFVASAVCTAYITYGGFAGAALAGAFFPAMLGVHAIIGIGEAFITTAVVAAVLSTRPDLVANADRLGARERRRRSVPVGGIVVAGLLAALVAGMGLSYLASSQPDGLEASVLGTACADAFDRDACLAEASGDAVFDAAPLPDYAVGWLSGLVGVAACFAVGAGAVLAVRSRRGVPAGRPESSPT